jgi:hypothetical protein
VGFGTERGTAGEALGFGTAGFAVNLSGEADLIGARGMRRGGLGGISRDELVSFNKWKTEVCHSNTEVAPRSVIT